MTRSYTRYAILPFDRASRNFGISCFLFSITRCDKSSVTKMPRGFSLRAACRMQSWSLYVTNLTTMVFGWPVELGPVRCPRSMRIALPHDCLGVSPIFGSDFCYPVDPQIVSSRLIFDVVDAVFHFALCAGYLFDIFGGVGQSVALAVDGHLHHVYLSPSVLQAHAKVRDLSRMLTCWCLASRMVNCKDEKRSRAGTITRSLRLITCSANTPGRIVISPILKNT